MGIDGSGVTVAVLADGLDPKNPDFVRNGAYGQAGSPVIAQYLDFSGDGTKAPTDGAEAFGDASSIVAQGNEAIQPRPVREPRSGRRLSRRAGAGSRIVGVAPGASLLALKVIGNAQGAIDLEHRPSGAVRRATRGEGHKRVSRLRRFPRHSPRRRAGRRRSGCGRRGHGRHELGRRRPHEHDRVACHRPRTSSAWAPPPTSATTHRATRAASTTPSWATAPGSATTWHLSPRGVTASPEEPSTSSPLATRTGPCVRPTPSATQAAPIPSRGKDIGVQSFGGTSEAAPTDCGGGGRRHTGLLRHSRRHRSVAGACQGNPVQHGHRHQFACLRARRGPAQRPRCRQACRVVAGACRPHHDDNDGPGRADDNHGRHHDIDEHNHDHCSRLSRASEP